MQVLAPELEKLPEGQFAQEVTPAAEYVFAGHDV